MPDLKESSAAKTFFDFLNDQEQAYLHDHGRIEQFSSGQSLFEHGKKTQRVIILLEGRVKVVVPTDQGRESLLALRGPNDVLGELSALDHKPHAANVVAIGPIKALTISGKQFRFLVENSPRASLWLLTRMVTRLRESDRSRVEFGVSDTPGRVAGRIVELADRYGREVESGLLIDLPLSQEEMATWVGTTREGVNRALHTFRDLGWVETERRMITVLNLPALQKRAGVSVDPKVSQEEADE